MRLPGQAVFTGSDGYFAPRHYFMSKDEIIALACIIFSIVQAVYMVQRYRRKRRGK